MERRKVRKEGRILRDLTPELKSASPQAAPLPLISPEGGHGLGLAPKDHAWVLRLLSQVLGSSGFSGEELPAIQETQVQFLGQEDPLEKEKTHRRKHNGNFHDIEFHNGILDMTPKGNTLDLIKI